MEAEVRRLRLHTGITVPCLVQENVQEKVTGDTGANARAAAPRLGRIPPQL